MPRIVMPLAAFFLMIGLAAAGEKEAIDALKKAKAQVVQDRTSKSVTEVRFTSKSQGDPLLDSVAECKGLVKVFIAGPGDFSDEGVAKLKGMKKLETANLHVSRFTDKAVAHMVECPRLRWLSLSGTKITDAAGDDLKKMENLETLSVAMTGVGNDIVGKVAGLPNLKDLHLTGTQVDDKVFAEVGKIKNLRMVALHGTKVTPEAVEKFKKAHPNVIVGFDPPKK